jgi:hypothetical protein
MDAVDNDRIERAQVCLRRARAESSEADVPSLVGELTHHLEVVLSVITSIRIMSGELDDAQLVLTPRARALARQTDAH